MRCLVGTNWYSTNKMTKTREDSQIARGLSHFGNKYEKETCEPSHKKPTVSTPLTLSAIQASLAKHLFLRIVVNIEGTWMETQDEKSKHR